MSINWTAFALGLFGGAVAELLKWYQLFQNSTNSAEYKKTPMYWIVTVLMIIASGILTAVYGDSVTSPVLAVNIGISAPLILKGLAGAAPALPGGGRALRGEPIPATVLNFIAGR